MPDLRRRSYLPEPPGPPGAGWALRCPGCQQAVETRDAGRCPGCGEAVAALADPLPADAQAAPLPLSRPVLGLFCFLLGLGPALWIAAGMALEEGLVALVFTPFLYLGLYPVSIPFTLGARALYRRVHPPRVGVGRQFDSRVEIQKLWRDITRLRGRRGLVLSLALRAGYLQGKRLEVVARLRGPDGRYLRGQLRNYRGELGEVRVRYTTSPIQNMVALFERIWMFVPMRALGLPPGTRDVELTAEVLVGVEGTTYAEAELPVVFRLLPEDFPHLLPEPAAAEEAAAEGDAVHFLEAGPAAPGASACGVCGDPLAGEVQVRCDLCDAPHHPECWEYLGGCSTYACEGRPAAA